MEYAKILFCSLLLMSLTASCPLTENETAEHSRPPDGYTRMEILVYNYTSSVTDITAICWYENQQRGEDILKTTKVLAPGTFFLTTGDVPTDGARQFLIDVPGKTLMKLSPGWGLEPQDMYMIHTDSHQLIVGFDLKDAGSGPYVEWYHRREGLDTSSAPECGTVEL